MSLKSELTKLWAEGSLPQSSVISCSDYEKAESEIMDFITDITAKHSAVKSENNIDIIKIELKLNKSGNELKHISVEQIRDVQDHFSSTSGITPFKFCLILGAEQMNLNASNCLLKILEDTPENGYIFLVTDSHENLIATIRSRCINIFAESGELEKNYDKEKAMFCRVLNPEIRYDDKVSDIDTLASDKKTKQEDVVDIILSTILSIATMPKSNELQDLEDLRVYIEKTNIPQDKLHKFYDETRSILKSTLESYLDMRQVILVLVSKFVMLR